jgi:hypothetical protein
MQMKIEIKSPCQENWGAMSVKEQGRFCNKCQTIVVDFSKKTEAEIVDFIKTQGNKSICGRFEVRQLGKEYNFSNKKPLVTNYRRIATLFLATFLSLGAESCKFKPNSHVKGKTKIISVANDSENKDTPANINKLSGRIIDEATENGIENATIFVEELELTLTTNSDGIFSFHLPENYQNSLTLKIMSDYYPNKIVKIRSSDFSLFQQIRLEKVVIKVNPPIIMGKVDASHFPPKTIKPIEKSNNTFKRK